MKLSSKHSMLGVAIALVATWALLVVGCQTTQTAAKASTAQPAATSEGPIDTIMAMRKAGQITDQQAAGMLSALLDEKAASGGSRAVDSFAPSARTVAAPAAPPKPSPTPVAEPAESAATNGLAAYTQRETIQGRLRSIGSDTMDKLMQLWEEGFKGHHPGIRLYHEGKGSSTAPSALIEGRSDFGPMSRAIKGQEVEQFKARFGYEPTQFRVAIDALAVYVHPDNPIARQGLDLQQVDAIFSSTRSRGGAKDIVVWGDLGLTGEWANAPINVYSRNKASGTYGFFRDTALKKGEYKTSNREMVGSEAVVTAVGQDRFGIGYSGIGYKTPAVVTVPLAEEPGGTKFPAEQEYAYSSEYPLARFLYLTCNMPPDEPATAMQREFMHYVYSGAGQQLVTKDGYYPLSPAIVAEELAKINN